MTKLRTVIVGTGNIAHGHVRAINEAVSDWVEIVAAVDLNSVLLSTFCQQHHIATQFTDYDQMLETIQPDLVQLCTPPGTHLMLAVKAMEAGAHVLCEKPLVASLNELDQLQAAERRTGRFCSVVFQWRFGSGAQHVKRLINRGVLGRPLVGICNTMWYRTHEYFHVPWRSQWSTAFGGVSIGHGIHAMDLFLWLMGDWTEVTAIAGTIDRDMEVEDVSMAHVRFANGALGSVVNSVLSPREDSYLRFDFQRATIELDHVYRYTNENWCFSIPKNGKYEADWDDELEQWQAIPDDVPNRHEAQMMALVNSIEKGELPLTTGDQARRTVEFLTALYKSALTRQPIQWGSILPDDPYYHRMYGPAIPSRDFRLTASK